MDPTSFIIADEDDEEEPLVADDQKSKEQAKDVVQPNDSPQ